MIKVFPALMELFPQRYSWCHLTGQNNEFWDTQIYCTQNLHDQVPPYSGDSLGCSLHDAVVYYFGSYQYYNKYTYIHFLLHFLPDWVYTYS